MTEKKIRAADIRPLQVRLRLDVILELDEKENFTLDFSKDIYGFVKGGVRAMKLPVVAAHNIKIQQSIVPPNRRVRTLREIQELGQEVAE